MLVLALLLAAIPPAADTAITKRFSTQGENGIAVGIVRDGSLVGVRTSGLRDRSTSAAVDADTRFEIGSITKQFTAAAVLQLQERGKLSIDDRLAKYLPSFPHADEVTLRQLLNQESGLPEYLEMPDVDALMTMSADAAPKIAAFVGRKPLDFAPGTRWEYSNTNYWVLGEVVARVSGATWEEYLRKDLFAPAGMTHSGFIADESSMSDFASPYWQGSSPGGPLKPAPKLFESWPGAAGAVVSTVGDLAAWNAALRSGKIVTRGDYELMTSAGTLANGKRTDYGMGLVIDTHEGHNRIWHNGATLGSQSMDAIYPDDHLQVIVLTNTSAGNPAAIETSVLEALYPDALAFAREPAPGEDLSVRPKIVRILGEILSGSLQANELAAQMQDVLPMIRKAKAKFASFGAPTAVIFKSKADRPDGVYYLYRVEFPNVDAENLTIKIDKATGLIGDLRLEPAG